MKKELIIITAYILLALGHAQAQNESTLEDSISQENKTVGDSNRVVGDETPFQKQRSNPASEGERMHDATSGDDSTGASGGMGALSTTPGVSTTTGAGGLGTNENPGYNTSSDIYNIERKDSIRKANKGRKEKSKTN